MSIYQSSALRAVDDGAFFIAEVSEVSPFGLQVRAARPLKMP
jgi:hypothetical protein